MKTKEFMSKVRSLGFGIIQEGPQLVIRTIGSHVIARVNRPSQLTEIVTFTISSAVRRELLNIISEYTGTPPEEREEEKRYWLRLATKIDVYEDRRYLNMDIPNEKYTLSENKDDAYYKAIFTESEIAQMDITGFEKVEVTE